MYLTTERLRTAKGQHVVNGALYAHPHIASDDPMWTLADLDVVTRAREEHDRDPRALRIEVPPGGNFFEGDLEVAFPDDVDANALSTALAKADALSATERSFVRKFGPAVVLYRPNVELPASHAIFADLRKAAIDLFEHGEIPIWMQSDPLEVRVSRDREEDAQVFTLTDTGAQRVLEAGGSPASIRLAADVARSFREMVGPLYPHVAQWVTSLSVDALLALGGVRFVDAGDGSILKVWPPRK